MGKRPFWVWGTLLLALTLVGSSEGVKLGFGFGTIQSADKTEIGAIEVFGGKQLGDWLASDFTLCYLPAILPGEGSALLLEVGLRGVWGEKLRLSLGIGGGAVCETGILGLAVNPSLSGRIGMEFWFGPRFGIYGRAALVVALRDTPYGRVPYPYLPWSIGVQFSSPSLVPSEPEVAKPEEP